MCLLSQCTGGKDGRIRSSASPSLHSEFEDQPGLTGEPVKKRKRGRKKAGEGGGIMLLLYSTLRKSRETSRTGFIILSFEVWVALEPQKLRFSTGTGFLRNICFSATHMEKHLPFVMFVCLLVFDGKHCEISFGALPVVNLCNV